MPCPLNGHVAVVTGGTGTLGSAVVLKLLSCGATCHVTHIRDEPADRLRRDHQPARLPRPPTWQRSLSPNGAWASSDDRRPLGLTQPKVK